MIYLLIVSIIWALSFGLIEGKLTGIDSNLVSFIRLLISFLFFLPFIKIKKYERTIRLKLFFTGMIQYGLMYSMYIYSYTYLKAYEVALFTIFTPLYVTLIHDALLKRINKLFLVTSSIAVIGAAIIEFENLSNKNLLIGFLLIQISNISFAFGQVVYKKILSDVTDVIDREVFSLMFLGGMLVPLLFALFTVKLNSIHISIEQWIVLLYLGVVASGIGFFLWNVGARKTNTGALAIFNNLKVPLGIAVSIIIFGETANIFNLFIGGLIVLGSLLINQYILTQNSSNQNNN